MAITLSSKISSTVQVTTLDDSALFADGNLITAQGSVRAYSDGTGYAQFNRCYAATRPLAAGGIEDFNLCTMGGNLDSRGRSFALTAVKFLKITNNGNGNLKIGGKGTTAAFTSIFNANTDKAIVLPGGDFTIATSTAAGFLVGGSGTNSVLTIENTDTAAMTFDILVGGCQ